MQILPDKQDRFDKVMSQLDTNPRMETIFSFAERFADILERKMAAEPHKSPTQIILAHATDASGAADTDGISGWFYQLALEQLSEFWVHGELINKWRLRQLIDLTDEPELSPADVARRVNLQRQIGYIDMIETQLKAVRAQAAHLMSEDDRMLWRMTQDLVAMTKRLRFMESTSIAGATD